MYFIDNKKTLKNTFVSQHLEHWKRKYNLRCDKYILCNTSNATEIILFRTGFET